MVACNQGKGAQDIRGQIPAHCVLVGFRTSPSLKIYFQALLPYNLPFLDRLPQVQKKTNALCYPEIIILFYFDLSISGEL